MDLKVLQMISLIRIQIFTKCAKIECLLVGHMHNTQER